MRARLGMMGGRGVAVAAVAVIVGVAVVWPALGVVGLVMGGATTARELPVPIRWNLIWPTLGWCGSIAVVATVLALPGAWVARGNRAVSLALSAPLLLPTYLAYAAWGMLRAPGTWLGDWLMRGPAGVEAGGNWWPVAAGRVQAFLGVVCWAWPLAAMVIAPVFAAIDQPVLDQMVVDGARPWRRVAEVLRLAGTGLALGAGAVFLVTVGSAVPLHVAQIDIYAIAIWRLLDELPWDQRWRVWVAAWPLVAIAVGAGVLITRRFVGGEGEGAEAGETGTQRGRTRWGPAAIGAALVWAVSVVAPLVIVLKNLKGWREVVRFWRISWASAAWSGAVAAGVMALALMIGGAFWLSADSRAGWLKRSAAVALGALVVAGVMPGILVGSAVAQTWGRSGLRWMGDSAFIVVLGHVARFGFVAAVAGWGLARAEPRVLRDLRWMDAGGSVRAWVAAAVRPRWAVVAAVVLACGVLSFHEIESAVMLQPPTSAGGGFAWRLLQALHYNREEDLVPAMATVMGVGVLGAAAVMWLGKGTRRL